MKLKGCTADSVLLSSSERIEIDDFKRQRLVRRHVGRCRHPPFAVLGARGLVYYELPGVVQDFGSGDLPFGWALCALPGQRVVAVDGEVWNSLLNVGRAARAHFPLATIGFPAPGEDSPRCIESTVLRISLAGGEWGEGALVRDGLDRRWHWEPEPVYDMNLLSDAARWEHDSEGEMLRTRLVSVLPWAATGKLGTNPQRRTQLLEQLGDGALADYLTRLAQAHGAGAQPVTWTRVPNSNTRDALCYSWQITAPDGNVAFTARVWLRVRGSMQPDVVACVEAQIVDLGAWKYAAHRAQSDPGEAARLSMREVAEFYAIGWHTATAILPTAAGEQLPVWYTRPPQTQFILATDRGSIEQPYPQLDRYVNLTPLGPTDRDQVSRMAIAVTAAPPRGLDRAASISHGALVEMAQQFGYIDATEESLE